MMLMAHSFSALQNHSQEYKDMAAFSLNLLNDYPAKKKHICLMIERSVYDRQVGAALQKRSRLTIKQSRVSMDL